jgi:hypothetical protein
MAKVRVYIQPRFPAAVDQNAFYDFSSHIGFENLEWEQNDQGNASTLRADVFTSLPGSSTHWLLYAGATESQKIQAALYDQNFHLTVRPRTEIQVRDISTSPHTILWGGVVTRFSEHKDGGAIVGSIDAVDYTALLNESVALEFTPVSASTIKQTITSQTYNFTPTTAERTAGKARVTVSGSIALGSPYSRDLIAGDTIVVSLSDNTYNGVHKVTGVYPSSSSTIITYQQFSNVADAPSKVITGAVAIPGFMTTNNAPQLDSRISVLASDIENLNPDWNWSPRNPNISRGIAQAARTGNVATITTIAQHGFSIDQVITVAITSPSGFSVITGTYPIASTPTDSSFTYVTTTTGDIAQAAAVGTIVASGEITPTPFKGGTLARNLQYAVDKGNGSFYLDAGTLDVSGNLTINLKVKSKSLTDLISNGLFDANASIPISTIKSAAETTKTIITSYPHGIFTGYVITITGAVGTNAADINNNSYAVTVTSSTSFTISAATSNSLNLSGGVATVAAYSSWSLGSFSIDTAGTTGPYGIGNTAYFTGSTHVDAELASTNRIAVVSGQKYFVAWRQKSSQVNKSHLHIKFYNSLGAVVGNSHGYDICKSDIPNNEWGRNFGLIVVPATATYMTPVLHHDSFSSSYTVYYTDIQIIKLTGSFGFSDKPIEDNSWYNSINATGIDLRDFENPSAPEESGESANRIYIYAPYTVDDPLTGAKQLTSYRNTYDFVQGVWEAGGKRIEGSVVEINATDATTSLLTAQKYFKDKGRSLKSFEFEHISGPLSVGDVIPFIWNELGIGEALVVRRQVGYMVGDSVYYRVQLGGDLSFQRSTMYLVEKRLQEISGDAAYFSPPPSPYPGTATEGGILTPAVPLINAGQKTVELSWQYPQKILQSNSFGGFIVLRGTTQLVGSGTLSATGDGTNATITTNADHGLSAGDEVVLSNILPASYNGGYTVLSIPTTSSFTIKNSTTNNQSSPGAIYKIANWYKASTSETPAGAENPLAPETSVPSYADANLTSGQAVAYKVAAIDVSGPTPVITGYSQISGVATPTDTAISFDNAYSGLGINVPKLVTSVTYDNITVTVPISGIVRIAGSATATVTTVSTHSFTAGMPVGIANTSNDSAIKGFYKILASPAPTSTTFSVTTQATTSLTIVGGSSNGYGDATARTNLSNAYIDNNGTSRNLGDSYSISQYPVGQIAFSTGDGKLYRNGLPGTSAFDNLWIRAAIDAADVSPDGTIRISADRIATGTLDAGIINVTHINADNIETGKISIDNAWGANAGSANVSYVSRLSNVATLWTATSHGFSVSDTLYVHTGLSSFDGIKTVTSLSVPVSRQVRVGTNAAISTPSQHNITSGESITTTSLNAALTGTFSVTGLTAPVTHSSLIGSTSAVRTSRPHAFSAGDSVTITGSGSNFNVSGVSIAATAASVSNRAIGTPVSASNTSTTFTMRTSGPHGFIVGDSVAISGVTSLTSSTYAVTAISSPVSHYWRNNNTVTLRTSQYHQVQAGDSIYVSGLSSPYSGLQTVLSSYGVTSNIISGFRGPSSVNLVLRTSAPHGFIAGDSVVISGVSTTFNGTRAVTETAASISAATSAGTTATVSTTIPHGFLVGDYVTVSGVGAPYDGTFQISAVSQGGSTSATYPGAFSYVMTAAGTTKTAGGTADNGRRFVCAGTSGSTAPATFNGTALSYSTISYSVTGGSASTIVNQTAGSGAVENGNTFSVTATSAANIPTTTASGAADSYQSFSYPSSGSGFQQNTAVSPNGAASTGQTVYFTTVSTGTIAPSAPSSGRLTNNRIISYANTEADQSLTSVSLATVVKKTDIYAISSNNFSVDVFGNVIANNATLTSASVSGAITASSGSIGGLTVKASNGGLYYPGIMHLDTSSDYVSTPGTTPGYYRFWIGNDTPTSASFAVDSDGIVDAASGFYSPAGSVSAQIIAGEIVSASSYIDAANIEQGNYTFAAFSGISTTTISVSVLTGAASASASNISILCTQNSSTPNSTAAVYTTPSYSGNQCTGFTLVGYRSVSGTLGVSYLVVGKAALYT